MTRRKFYAAMRKLGFSSKGMQMTRGCLTYHRDINGSRVWVTVPKKHMDTFHITGNIPCHGIYVIANDRTQWGEHINPAEFGASNMFEICLWLLEPFIPAQEEAA